DRLGKIKLAGHMADGHQLKQGVQISKDGYWPMFSPLYKEAATVNGKAIVITKGMAMGWLELADHPVTGNKAPKGEIHWINTGWTNTAYAAGFTNSAEVVGSRWAFNPLQLESALTNIVRVNVDFLGGEIGTGFSATYDVSPKTTFVVIKGDPTITYPNLVKTALGAKTGLFKGTFVHPVSTAVTKFFGVMLQDEGYGEGFFMGTNVGGKVEVSDAAAINQ
ncbi:MAG: hypothetical protein ACK4UN_12535, partial [Limisphaerales bacterium]